MALSPLQQAASQTPRTAAYEVPNWLQYGNGTGATGPDGGNKVGLYTNQGKYTLYDNRTGKVLAEGSSPEELKNISDIITGTLVPQGNDADWRLYSTNPVVQINPHREFLGGGEGPLKLEGNPFGDVIQGYNDLSTPGDPRGTVIAGDMPNNLFKDMILPLLAVPAATMGAYFGGNALLGATGGGSGAGAGSLSGITGSSAGNAALSSLANVPIGAGLPATTTGLGAGVSAIGGAAGTAAGGTALGGGAGIGGLGGGAGFAGPGITVIGKPGLTALQAAGAFSPGVGVANAFTSPGGAGAGSPTGPSTTGTEGIEVVGQPVKPYIPPITIPPVFTTVPPVNVPQVPTDLGSPKLPGKGVKVPYGRIISGVLGGIGGASGGQPDYLGTGTRNPIFDAELPAPSLPGGVSSMTAREVPEQNWYEYGFNPEQSFFNTSAPGYTPKPGKTPGMARGGDFAVSGPGDGRSDSIPARLSDGEYVIDAETVALLGNGSAKAGAERLDAFRVNVRKHKGRDLARGKFSVKAKRPEAYMAGGRT